MSLCAARLLLLLSLTVLASLANDLTDTPTIPSSAEDTPAEAEDEPIAKARFPKIRFQLNEYDEGRVIEKITGKSARKFFMNNPATFIVFTNDECRYCRFFLTEVSKVLIDNVQMAEVHAGENPELASKLLRAPVEELGGLRYPAARLYFDGREVANYTRQFSQQHVESWMYRKTGPEMDIRSSRIPSVDAFFSGRESRRNGIMRGRMMFCATVVLLLPENRDEFIERFLTEYVTAGEADHPELFYNIAEGPIALEFSNRDSLPYDGTMPQIVIFKYDEKPRIFSYDPEDPSSFFFEKIVNFTTFYRWPLASLEPSKGFEQEVYDIGPGAYRHHVVLLGNSKRREDFGSFFANLTSAAELFRTRAFFYAVEEPSDKNLEFFGVDRRYLPKISVVVNKTRKFHLNKRATVSNIIDHVEAVLDGTAPESFRSEPMPAKSDVVPGKVRKVVRHNFLSVVIHSKDDVLLAVTSSNPECTLCQDIKDSFTALAKKFEKIPKLVFASIDVLKNDIPVFEPTLEYRPTDIPFLIFYSSKTKWVPKTYSLKYFDVDNIRQFVAKYVTVVPPADILESRESAEPVANSSPKMEL